MCSEVRMKNWLSWQKSYVHGALTIWPPDEVRDYVNRIRKRHDPESFRICEAHITLTQPFCHPPVDNVWDQLQRTVSSFSSFDINWGSLNTFLPYPCLYFEISPRQPLRELRHALHQTGLFNLSLPHSEDDFVPHMSITDGFPSVEKTQQLFDSLKDSVEHGTFRCQNVVYIKPDRRFHFRVVKTLNLGI